MQHELQARIVDILARCMDMTIATVMPDGAPHATVVSFAHDGLTLYFGCGARSHKATNIARDPRVALTVTPPYAGWDAIQGLSIEAEAHEVTAPAELAEVQALMLRRFPQLAAFEVPEPGTIKVFRLRPTLVAVLDYSRGFGHTDVVRVGDDDIAESLESMAHHWLMVPAPV